MTNYQVRVEKLESGDWFGEVIVPPTRQVFGLHFNGKEWDTKRSVINRMTRYLNDLEGYDPDKEENEDNYVLRVNP